MASGADVAAMEDSFRAGGKGYGHYKQQLFEALWETFRSAREKRAELAADPGYVDGVLREGAARARALARSVLDRVRAAAGL